MYKNFLLKEYKKDILNVNGDYSMEALFNKLNILNDDTLYNVSCIGYNDKLIINDMRLGIETIPNTILRITNTNQKGGMVAGGKKNEILEKRYKGINYTISPLYPRDFLVDHIHAMLPSEWFAPKKNKTKILADNVTKVVKAFAESERFGQTDDIAKITEQIRKDIKKKYELDIIPTFIDPFGVINNIISGIEGGGGMEQKQRFIVMMLGIMPYCCNNNCFRQPKSDPEGEFIFQTIRQECTPCSAMRIAQEKGNKKPSTGYKIFVINEKIYFMEAVPEILKTKFCENALPHREKLFDKLKAMDDGLDEKSEDKLMEALIMTNSENKTFELLSGKKQQCPLNLIPPFYKFGIDDKILKINPEYEGISKIYSYFVSNCFEQDHISAHHTDNTAANLWTLCKICHAQKTKTGGDFSGKKKDKFVDKNTIRNINKECNDVSGLSKNEISRINKNMFKILQLKENLKGDKLITEYNEKILEMNESIKVKNKDMSTFIEEIFIKRKERNYLDKKYQKDIMTLNWLKSNLKPKYHDIFGDEFKEPDMTIPLKEKIIEMNINDLIMFLKNDYKFEVDIEKYENEDYVGEKNLPTADLKYYHKKIIFEDLTKHLEKRKTKKMGKAQAIAEAKAKAEVEEKAAAASAAKAKAEAEEKAKADEAIKLQRAHKKSAEKAKKAKAQADAKKVEEEAKAKKDKAQADAIAKMDAMKVLHKGPAKDLQSQSINVDLLNLPPFLHHERKKEAFTNFILQKLNDKDKKVRAIWMNRVKEKGWLQGNNFEVPKNFRILEYKAFISDIVDEINDKVADD